MLRKSALVLTFAVALLALVRCEVAFPKETYRGTVAGGGSGTGGAATGGTSGTSGNGGGGGDCFPSPDQKFCGGDLCPPKTDPAHGCASTSCAPCSVPNATAVCAADGTCAMGTCDSGFTDCNADPTDGCEINTAQDPKNCGSCGHDCSAQSPGTNWACQNGQCEVSNCPSGKGDCNKDPSDGCEINLTTDVKNCAFCGNDCSSAVLHATPTCTNGSCSYSACAPGWADCDGNKANGCEADIATDTANCGSCGKMCNATNGQAACLNGQCTIGCKTGYANCDGNNKNGCETNLDTDPNHCGSCANACSTSHDNPACSGGQCSLQCLSGWADCDGNKADGCETSVGDDANNCGSCGYKCAAHVLNASGLACANGTCSYASCSSGWSDCDANKANGCEAALNQPATCGSCSNDCTTQVLHVSNVTCAGGGNCSYSGSCAAGYADCDGNKANGCETDLHSDAHCGACNITCTGSKTCQYVGGSWGCY